MLFSLSLTLFLSLARAWTPQSLALENESELEARWLKKVDKIRGVNLGSQFVFERWSAEDEWTSMGCHPWNDEWACTKGLGQEKADAAFKKHWDTWITEDDIKEIAWRKLNTVRIPLGYWMREDLVKKDEYFPRGGLKYLDRLVGWCAHHGLYVILDLHAAPGSQNTNEQFTGHSVPQPGFYTAENYERANKFLEWMTNRIHTNGNYSSVGMLQVLNEPMHGSKWEKETTSMRKDFYPAAYKRIQAAETKLGIPNSKRLHIQFMGKGWGSGDPREFLPSGAENYTFFDSHRYYSFDTRVPNNKKGYITSACKDNLGGDNLVVGEWSLSVNSSIRTTKEFEIDNRPDQISWYRGYWAAQAEAFERNGGWIFWTWKCNNINKINEWRWCYKSAIRAGVIPEDSSKGKELSPCSRYV